MGGIPGLDEEGADRPMGLKATPPCCSRGMIIPTSGTMRDAKGSMD